MDKIKLTVVGGGSSYTPELIEELIHNYHEVPIGSIFLLDTSQGVNKLNIIATLAKRMIKKAGLNIEVIPTTDAIVAVKDADFIIIQIRVGGSEARKNDEMISAKYSLVGQETVGAGGFTNALRTIPVVLEIVKIIEKYAPKTWIINVTNPAGIITETIKKHSRVNIVGLCNVPLKINRLIAQVLNQPLSNIKIDYVGLNHLLWGHKIYVEGRDVTEKVLREKAPQIIRGLQSMTGVEWPKEHFKKLGALPCIYPQYYYMPKLFIQRQKTYGLRGNQVQFLENELFKAYQIHNKVQVPEQLKLRGGFFYSKEAVNLISTIYKGKQELHVVNIENNCTIPGLPQDAIIEVSAVFTGKGFMPMNIGELPDHIRNLIVAVKNFEELTIEAGIRDSYSFALKAFQSHPLVPKGDLAQLILNKLLTADSGTRIANKSFPMRYDPFVVESC